MANNQEIISTLSEKYATKTCHSMASLVRGDEVDGKSADALTTELFNSKFLASAKRHSKSQDTVADLVELANIIIDAPAEEGIGEELVHRVDVMMPGSKKIRVREIAKTSKTARGKTSKATGSRNSYITIDPNEELEAHETWDDNFIEDADWNVAQDETEALATALKLETSQLIIDKLVSVPAAQTNTGNLFAVQTANTLTFDDIVEMRQTMKSNQVTPDCLVLNSLQLGDLLKQEVFQDSLLYGDFVDKGMGYIGSLFGMDVYETFQIPQGHVLMFKKRYTMIFGVRRYAMLKSFDDFDAKKGKVLHGLQISTRYELKVGNAKYLLRCENA